MKTEIISAYRQGIKALMEPKCHNGFFGISAIYPFFSNEPLEGYCEDYYNHKCIDQFIEFGAAHFDNFLVFLGDYLLHYNLMAFCGMEEEKAKSVAREAGNILEKKVQNAIGKYKEGVSLLRFENLMGDENFCSMLGTVSEYANTNSRFMKECTDLTISGTWNKLKVVKHNYGNKKYKQALSIARNYSFGDIALCLYLYNHFPVQISKYEPPLVIKNIYGGIFPELKNKLNLADMGHIQASFDKGSVYPTFYDDQQEGIAKNEK